MSVLQLLLALHLLAVALGIGSGFSNLINLRVSKGQTGDVAKGLGLMRMALRPYGDFFAATIVVTGVLLLWTIGGTTGLNGWFSVKMAAVIVFVLSYIGVRLTGIQMMKSGNMALMTRVGLLAHVAVAGAVIALVCAVLTFAA